MDDISGNAAYDVATSRWGSPWRMPTYDEVMELVDECTWTQVVTSYAPQTFYVIAKGPNGNSIILPAPGYKWNSICDLEGQYGNYWSSTPTEYNGNAYKFSFTGAKPSCSAGTRYYGYSIRPVSD